MRWDRSLCLYLNKMLNILPMWNWSSFPQSCTQISCWENLIEVCALTSLVTFLIGDLHVHKYVHKFIWFDQISLLALINLLTRGLGMKLTVINLCSPTWIQKIQPTHKVINVVQWTNKPWKQIMRFVTLFGIIKCLGCNIWCRPRERNTTTRKTAKAIWNRRSKVYHLWCCIRITDDRWIAFQI